MSLELAVKVEVVALVVGRAGGAGTAAEVDVPVIVDDDGGDSEPRWTWRDFVDAATRLLDEGHVAPWWERGASANGGEG